MTRRLSEQRLRAIGRELLLAIGEDPDREGLKDTPRRWAKWWIEFINHDPGNMDRAFTVERTDQLVAVTNIRVWSLCEHHLLPFWCDIAIGYITRDVVLGLSKFARIARNASHRLQLQERLVQQIAADVEEASGSPDVAVVAKGEHLCMIMRGVKSEAQVTTSVMNGRFRESAGLRTEFVGLCGLGESRR